MFAPDYMDGCPDEWKRTATKVATGATITGLFRTQVKELELAGGMLTDRPIRFDVLTTDADAIGLSHQDALLIDGKDYTVIDLLRLDFGIVSTTLRAY